MQACKHYTREGVSVTENLRVTSDFQLYSKNCAFFVRHSQGFTKTVGNRNKTAFVYNFSRY